MKRLIVRWDNRRQEHIIHYPKKCDGHLAHGMLFCPIMGQDWDKGGAIKFDPSYADELKTRGYDLSTLRFEIRLLPDKADKVKGEGR